MSDQIQNEIQEDSVVTSSSEEAVADDYSDGFMSAIAPEKEEKQHITEPDEGQKQNIPEDEKEVQQQPEQPSHQEDDTQKDNYKSLLGRHQRLQEEARQLREQQQRLLQAQHQSPPQTQPVFEKAEIPDELKDDIEAFKRKYPEYAGLIEVKGREGDRIRSVLSEYGADLAAGQAENLVTRIELARSKHEVSQQVSQQVAISHEQQIYAAHPDFAGLDVPGKRGFLESVRDWIEDLPMKEARKWEAVFDRGNTQETVQLFSEFKRSRQNTTTHNNSKQLNNARRQQTIEEGLAVPTSARGVRSGQSRPDPDDYSSGFMDACKGR